MEMLDRLGDKLEAMEVDQLRLKERADRVAVAVKKAEEDRAVDWNELIGKLEARQGTKQSSRPCKLGPSDVFTGMVAAVSQGMLFQGESACHMMV